MKIWLHHILILICTVMVITIGSAMAQDTGVPDTDLVDSEREKIEREKILYSPGEADIRYTPKNTTALGKDSAAVAIQPAAPKFKSEKPAPAPKTTVDKQSKEEADDSILSFNFLYYIIEKYKLQDIVD